MQMRVRRQWRRVKTVLIREVGGARVRVGVVGLTCHDGMSRSHAKERDDVMSVCERYVVVVSASGEAHQRRG
jgi:hypothetical protein